MYTPQTALVVVDCQNDFADPEGSLYVRGGEEVVAAVNAEIIKALAAGATLAYTQDWHPESTPHFQKDGGTWPVHCVGGTWGAHLHPRLIVAGPVIRKGENGEDGYSGFTMADPRTGRTTQTALPQLLASAEVRNVVVVGLALDYCVKATALDAIPLGHPAAVLRHATAPVDLEEGDGDQAIAEMVAAGVSIT